MRAPLCFADCSDELPLELAPLAPRGMQPASTMLHRNISAQEYSNIPLQARAFMATLADIAARHK
jgi:hypothetical protein